MEKTKNEGKESKRDFFLTLSLILMLVAFISVPSYFMKKDAFIVIKPVQKEDIDVYIGTTEENDTKEEKSAYEKAAETTVTVSENGEGTVTVVFPLDINSAGIDELLMIKGIGEKTAKNIVDYRKLNGYFFSMDELLNVEGIGEKKLEAFKEYLYIDYTELPETRVPIFNRDESTENAANTEMVTAVPRNDFLETTATVENVFDTEDFVMEIEEFVTEEDYDDFDDDYTDSDDYTEKTSTETEYSPSFPLDLNTASASDLTYINGIGESTAQKIVEYAEMVGFTSVDDLLNVSGIGKSKLEMIRPYVYVDSNYTADTNSETEESQIIPLELNTASASELTEINGIGEATAQKIVEYAEKVGFTSVDDLLYVSGIGKSKLELIRPYVYVDLNYFTGTYPETENTDNVSSETAEIYPVNLNSCTKEDLMQLPGIDEQTAENILNLRSEIGYFIKIEELFYVPLTNDQFNQILPYVFI